MILEEIGRLKDKYMQVFNQIPNVILMTTDTKERLLKRASETMRYGEEYIRESGKIFGMKIMPVCLSVGGYPANFIAVYYKQMKPRPTALMSLLEVEE